MLIASALLPSAEGRRCRRRMRGVRRSTCFSHSRGCASRGPFQVPVGEGARADVNRERPSPLGRGEKVPKADEGCPPLDLLLTLRYFTARSNQTCSPRVTPLRRPPECATPRGRASRPRGTPC